MRILIIGDVFSKLGRASLERNLPIIREQYQINFVIANGENASHGKGMNINHYKWFMEQGVNVVTMGNHSFHNKAILEIIDEKNNIVVPFNYANETPGKGYLTINYNGTKITVFQVLGEVFMHDEVVSPFEKTEEILENVESDIFICDFHAEATSEKVAFAHHFDGRINIIYGTHTHVQTNDARVLPNGTVYITDVGMTGPHEGIIGVEKDIIIDRFVNQTQARFKPQNTGKQQFNGIVVEINLNTKKATIIDVLNIVE